MGDQLHPITNAEHWGDIEQRGVSRRDILAVHRVRAAAQDDTRWVPLADPVQRPSRWMNLRVHARFPDPARNQLGELGTVVQDQYSTRHVNTANLSLLAV